MPYMRCKADSDAILLLLCPCVLPHSVYGPRMSTPALWLLSTSHIIYPLSDFHTLLSNMIEFQLQRETPSSTIGFGFFEACVGSLFVEYFQFCFPLESSVRIVMTHLRAQRKMNERGSIPGNEAGVRKTFSGGRLCLSWRSASRADRRE